VCSSDLRLFNTILDNNHIGDVLIVNTPFDEFVLEVREDLAEQYVEILEKCMIEDGNFFLKSGLVEMKAEANIGEDWYEAK